MRSIGTVFLEACIKLSVLVPAYNLERYIEDCLSSVLAQQADFDYEVIVCDDASTDATAEVIRRIAGDHPRLRPMYKSENAGLSANIRTLIEAATGEYIAYLDGDDLALPGKLQRQVNYLDANPACQMVYHESDMFDSETDQSLRRYSQGFYNWSLIPATSNIEHLVRYGTYMQASSVMFRNHPDITGTVPESCRIILDYPFYLLNAGFLSANIDFIPDCLGRYRIHADSFGAQTQRDVGRRQQCCEDMVAACRLAAQFDVDDSVIEAGVAHHRFAAALYFLFREEDQLFASYLEQSAADGHFFDERHHMAWDLRDDPDLLRQRLVA